MPFGRKTKKGENIKETGREKKERKWNLQG
jgi:hypothetical protein